MASIIKESFSGERLAAFKALTTDCDETVVIDRGLLAYIEFALIQADVCLGIAKNGNFPADDIIGTVKDACGRVNHLLSNAKVRDGETGPRTTKETDE